MPELPEVETTRLGVRPHVVGRTVESVAVRQRALRHRVNQALCSDLPGLQIDDVRRRGKYLLFDTKSGSMLLHLGMSGSLRICEADEPPGAHDHVDVVLAGNKLMRLNDPRRFGTVLWTRRNPLKHKLLRELGPEPLSAQFDGRYLFDQSRQRRVAVKPFIMNGNIVVGVGNIYASESLFRAGIHPRRPAGRISLARYESLAQHIKDVLAEAIEQGGTSLRDFTGHDGQPGYFQQKLDAYGREGEPCVVCKTPLRQEVIGQRSSYFCVRCQR